ncbi:MAG: aminopeptidase P family protein [Acidimicrobiales bacterium]
MADAEGLNPEALSPPPPTTPQGPSEALVEFMARDWAPAVANPDQPAAAVESLAKRRGRLSKRFEGEWLVIPTGKLKVRANDTDYRFRPGSDFAWLTGYHEPDAVLVMSPASGRGHDAVLYATPRSDRSGPGFFTDFRYGELWVGPRLGLQDVSVLLGIATAPLSSLAGALKQADGARTRVLAGFDGEVEAMVCSGGDPDVELAQALAEERLIKDDHELSCLQAAVDATVLGFEDVVRALPEAENYSERWVEGTFNRRARTEGNDVGYETIAACGHHACTLHWVRNDGPVRSDHLLLLDAGVEGPELYTADVTRTLPVSGRFSPVQRDVYEAVWRAQKAGLAACRPGNNFMDPHRAAMAVLAEWLVERGILDCSVEEALAEENRWYTRYTLHGTSHKLGLDVHDCGVARNEHRHATLAPGMVLTVEPGCYLQPDDLTVPAAYRGIGVRIEDDVVITADGHRVLSAALPTQVDQVEAWMAVLLDRDAVRST